MTFHDSWYSDQQLSDLCGLLTRVLEGNIQGLFVEIGCWEGRSTVGLARILEPTGHQLHAVDWWLGNIDEGEDHPTVRALAERDVFGTFLANVAPYPCVTVHRQDGTEFLARMSHESEIAFIHLDAGHTYEATKALIDLALPRLARGGIICGDDFESSHAGRADLGGGVERAVRDAFSGDAHNAGNLWSFERHTAINPSWWPEGEPR